MRAGGWDWIFFLIMFARGMGLILDWMPMSVTWYLGEPHVNCLGFCSFSFKQQNCGCFYRHGEGKHMGYKGILAAGKISTLMVGEASCKTWHKGIMKGILWSPWDRWIKSSRHPWAWCRLPDCRYTMCRYSTSSGVCWPEMSDYILEWQIVLRPEPKPVEVIGKNSAALKGFGLKP